MQLPRNFYSVFLTPIVPAIKVHQDVIRVRVVTEEAAVVVATVGEDHREEPLVMVRLNKPAAVVVKPAVAVENLNAKHRTAANRVNRAEDTDQPVVSRVRVTVAANRAGDSNRRAPVAVQALYSVRRRSHRETAG